MKHATSILTITSLLFAASANAWPDAAVPVHIQRVWTETGQPVAAGQPAHGRSAIAIARDADGCVEDGHISVVINSDAYAIEIKDGKVVSAKRNGEAIPADRIEVLPEGVKVHDENGKVILDATTLPGARHGDGAHTWTVRTGHPIALAFPGQPGAQPAAGAWRMDPNEPKPTVMVGVRMSQPNKSLLRHLGLEEGKAIMVAGVGEGLPADLAGLKPYDLILAVDGKAVEDEMSLRTALSERKAKAGDTLSLTIIHAGQKKDVTITLAAFDEDKMSSGKWNLVEEDDANPSAFGVPMPQMRLDQLPEGDARKLREQLRQTEQQVREQVDRATREAARAAEEAAKAGRQGRRAPGAAGVGVTAPPELFIDTRRAQTDDRLARLEERLARLEELLNRLVGQHDKQPAPKP